MDTSKKLQASRVIDAPADDIFALLADPNRYLQSSGSGVKRWLSLTAAARSVCGRDWHDDAHLPWLEHPT